jgi:hypothetical protein
VDFEPEDVIAPYCTMGWDVIFRLQHRAGLTPNEKTRAAYEKAAEWLVPSLTYRMSLIATPDYTVTRWLPTGGLCHASLIIYQSTDFTRVQIAM